MRMLHLNFFFELKESFPFFILHLKFLYVHKVDLFNLFLSIYRNIEKKE